MKKIRRFTSLLLALAMISSLLLLSGCGGSGSAASGTGSLPPASTADTPASGESSSGLEPATDGAPVYTLKAGNTCTPDHAYNVGLRAFQELLYKKSDGHIILEIYPSGQLGNESDLLEGLQMGTVDIAVTASAPVVNFSNALAVLDLPYLFESKQHAFNVLDGEIGEQFWADLSSVGIKGLAFFDNGFMYVHTNTGFVNEPSNMKGLKIRTMENSLHQSFVNACGATATPMAMGEVFTALQNSTVNGTVNSTVTIYTSKWYTEAGYITHTDHIYATAPMTMSQISFDKLPAEYQEILLECAAEARDQERQAVADCEASAEADMISQGCEISYDVNIDAYKKIVYEKVWPEFVGKTIDADLVERIQALA